MNMKRFLLFAGLAGAVARAAGMPKQATVSSSGGTGLRPTTPDAGVALDGTAAAIRVTVTAAAGTITGGKVYCFYLGPTGVGKDRVLPTYPSNSWVRCPLLDLTVPTALETDAGTIHGMVFPDLPVVGSYGRVSFVPGTLTGTADDAGVNTYIVTTEAWGRTSP
jgi:hypothetical protein